MTSFEKQVRISAPIAEIYAFLADCNQHEALQPDNITEWTSTSDSAAFTIKNMGRFALKIASRIPNQEIKIVPNGPTPIDVTLLWTLSVLNDQETSVTLKLDADLNMMMKMIASGPLQKLVDHQAEQLKALKG